MTTKHIVFALLIGVVSWVAVRAAEPTDYLADGKLKHALVLSDLQIGGFAGRLETKIAIDADGSWTGAFGAGRLRESKGKLSAEQMIELAAALAEHDLAGLPKTIGSAKPVKSPVQIADGASTTITLTFGEQMVTANTADGVKLDEEALALLRRLRQIENAMRKVTLNAAADR